MEVAGIGGANIDIHGQSTAPIVMRDSNPGAMHLSPGGVNRNILENLCRMGVSTEMCIRDRVVILRAVKGTAQPPQLHKQCAPHS